MLYLFYKFLIMKRFKKLTFIALTCSLFFVTVLKAQTKLMVNEDVEFKVFPNPHMEGIETFVSLKGFKANDLLVIVYDMFGREIYSKVEVREEEGFLFSLASDGQRLPAGVYMITASADDKIFHQKLIVK